MILGPVFELYRTNYIGMCILVESKKLDFIYFPLVSFVWRLSQTQLSVFNNLNLLALSFVKVLLIEIAIAIAYSIIPFSGIPF